RRSMDRTELPSKSIRRQRIILAGSRRRRSWGRVDLSVKVFLQTLQRNRWEPFRFLPLVLVSPWQMGHSMMNRLPVWGGSARMRLLRSRFWLNRRFRVLPLASFTRFQGFSLLLYCTDINKRVKDFLLISLFLSVHLRHESKT